MNLTRRTLFRSASAVGLAAATWDFSAKAQSATMPTGDDGSAPHRLTPVPIDDVVIDDAFWSPKRDVWRTVTIPDCFAKFERDRGGALNNFDKVRGGPRGSHAGDPWMDGLVYEMIRGAADFLVTNPDPALAAQLEDYAERIAAAAAVRPDGYLNTYTQLIEPGHEWGENGGLLVWQHEIYNLGALVEAGVHLYRATGSTTLLTPAVTIANTMHATMGPPPKKNLVPAHPLPEEALVRLHELFVEQPALKSRVKPPVREADYLKLAEFWIENRGRNTGTPDWDKGRPAAELFVRERRYGDDRPTWGAYAQDHLPVFEQQTIEGHAVRAALLCAGVAAAAHVNRDQRYADAALRLWENMVHRRMHITGGVGAYAEEEKFGPDYALPNDAYLETCAAVGAGFFHRNMNLLFGHARYADELERVLFNGALSGVSIKGDTYLYTNPLESDAKRARWDWHSCPCCPPMFVKLMGAMPGYVYAIDDDGLYVNLFVSGRARVAHRHGPVEIEQTSRYPWDGDIRLAVKRAPDEPLAMMVRVPAWCEGATMTVNGRPVPTQDRTRGYVRIKRRWSAGDVVALDLPMPVRQVRADPRVKANLGRAALMRGPVVYCVESSTAAVTGSVSLRGAVFEPKPVAELGGIVALEGMARGHTPSETTGLYQPMPSDQKPVRTVAIPYYANLNRGPANMSVWLPLEI